jgi:hypothetical protein
MYEIKTLGGRVLFTAPDATTARQAMLAAVSHRANLRGVDLRGVDLRGVDLGGANLGGANLGGVDLGGAYLGVANLGGADFGGADLRGAYLGGANLGGANLRGAYLRGAYLRGADLRGAYLRGADFGGADLRGAYLSGTKEKREHVVTALKARAQRSDGYEFLWFDTEDGETIRAGCRTFTLKEFKAHVAEQYAGSPKAKETLRILAFLKAQANQESWY